MADMLPKINNQNDAQSDRLAESIASLLKEHNGQDVVSLNLCEINNWTDFFIIATVTSQTHMDGMEKHIKEFCRKNDIDILGSSRRNKKSLADMDDEWRLIDLGRAVIHLMTAKSREFYDLERLWHNSISK